MVRTKKLTHTPPDARRCGDSCPVYPLCCVVSRAEVAYRSVRTGGSGGYYGYFGFSEFEAEIFRLYATDLHGWFTSLRRIAIM
ncbi:MAG: hypothetical protein ACLS37_13540 [Alistipes sp.]